MKKAENLMREVLDTQAKIRDMLVSLIWSELERVVDSDAGFYQLVGKGYISKPKGIENQYKELLEKIKFQYRLDEESVKKVNDQVRINILTQMKDCGWGFDENENIISLIK